MMEDVGGEVVEHEWGSGIKVGGGRAGYYLREGPGEGLTKGGEGGNGGGR